MREINKQIHHAIFLLIKHNIRSILKLPQQRR